jgi:hypothetical protein
MARVAEYIFHPQDPYATPTTMGCGPQPAVLGERIKEFQLYEDPTADILTIPTTMGEGRAIQEFQG